MWGMTPVSEAVIQLRGEGGARQVAAARRRARVGQRRRPVDALDAGALEAGVVSETARPRRPAPSRRSRPRWRRSSRRRGATSWSAQRCSTAARSASRRARSAAAACRARAEWAPGRGRGRVFSSPSCTRRAIPGSRPTPVRRRRGRARRGGAHAVDRGRTASRMRSRSACRCEVDFEDVTPEVSLPVFRPGAR